MSSQPDQTYRPLTHYLDRLPGHRGGKRPHPSAALRWVRDGSPLPDGSRARLRAIRVGCRWLTCDEWWNAWVEQLALAHTPTPAVGQAPDAGVLRSPTARTRAATKAAAEPERMGA